MKKPLILFFAFFFFVLASQFSFSDSIWERTSTSPYSVSQSFRVGDIITIIILESTTAVQKAGTDTNNNDSLSSAFNSNLASFLHTNKSISGSGGNNYTGQGSTTRSSNVTAKVAAVVTKVLPNGNIVVDGEHRIMVNGEEQTLKVTGIIRPKDVSLSNSVFSYQVAGAQVSIIGKGPVGDAESPGFIPRFFNWFF